MVMPRLATEDGAAQCCSRGQGMADDVGTIRVNHAPVLTLWAATVAERLGHDEDAAITLGRAVAGASARVKARSISPEERHDDPARPVVPRSAAHAVSLLGREVPAVQHEGSDYALDCDRAASSQAARAYVEKAFGADLPAVCRTMETLAGSLNPAELNRMRFRLYEGFHPGVPPGTKRWGAKGVLDLGHIRDAMP